MTSHLSAEDLVEALEGARRTGEGRWTARCPAHGDKGPSLSVRRGDDGRVLLHCFAGCTFAEIVDAMGLEARQLFPPSGLPWRPSSPRPDPDAAIQAWYQRLQFLRVAPPPERYRNEMIFVGGILAGGTRALAEVADFKPAKVQSWGLRVLLQAAHALFRQGTPRCWFGLAAVAGEIDFAAARRGFARERGLLHLARLAVGTYHHASATEVRRAS